MLIAFGLLPGRRFLKLNTQSWRRHFLMDSNGTLKQDIKQMMVENLMLQVTAGEISDEQTLFGAGSLGLDSVDALQLVVALDKKYGLKILESRVRPRNPPEREHPGQSRSQPSGFGIRGGTTFALAAWPFQGTRHSGGAPRRARGDARLAPMSDSLVYEIIDHGRLVAGLGRSALAMDKAELDERIRTITAKFEANAGQA